MIAIYARQSVDRADSISVESQIEFCRHEARGGDCEIYIDRGFSGKDTNRPDFARMMDDIRAGHIERVIVYKLDRISRSILDFSAMMEQFERYGVDFVSSTERFDTSSPMGRAMLNICIVFAQLERETIQKRVADAYYARSRRSFYMGGPVPYGFALEPVLIDGKRTSRYTALPEEAQVVRCIYEQYRQPGVSCGDIAAALRCQGITRRGREWERARVADILRSTVYVRADMAVYRFLEEQGAVMESAPEDFIGTNGCYCYSPQGSADSRRGSLKGRSIVLAPHEGIIDSETWLRCRRKCLGTGENRPEQKAKNTWLAGRIKCGRCGYALVDKRYAKNDARYLLCSRRMNNGLCEGAGSMHTDEIERIISDQVQMRLERFSALHKRERQTDPELSALRQEMAQCRRQTDALLARLPEAGDALFRYINQQAEALERHRAELEGRCRQLEARHSENDCIISHAESWTRLSFEDRRAVLGLLIKVIRIADGRITIEWRM